MAIAVESVSLKELIEHARDAKVKRVLLTTYGSVEPVREGSATVLAGMTTVAATILDSRDARAPKICRWEEKGRSKGMVKIATGAGRVSVGAGGPVAQLRDDVHELLRDDGFEVDDGEWTPESAVRSIASRQRLIG